MSSDFGKKTIAGHFFSWTYPYTRILPGKVPANLPAAEHFREKFVTTIAVASRIGANRVALKNAGYHFRPKEKEEMSEFEEEVKKAEKELEQSLVPLQTEDQFTSSGDDEFLGELKMQAQEYGQKLQDAAVKAKDYASEKFARAGDKLKELQNKDPKELVEDAKEFARQKPGQTILISAAIGLVLGLLLRRK